MPTKPIRGHPAEETGPAVIELTAGVMILAILIAIAIPAFFGFYRTAQDRAAQREIESVLASEQEIRQERGEYTDDTAALTGLEPGVVIDGVDPALGVTVTLNSSAGALCIERVSASGVSFSVWGSTAQGTLYGRGHRLTGACPAAAPAGHSPEGW